MTWKKKSTKDFHIFFLLLFIFGLNISHVSTCPTSCACAKDNSMVICQKGSWNAIEPNLLIKGIERLILQDVSNLQTFKAHSLKRHKDSLKELKINSDVQIIEPSAFASLHILEALDLSQNNLFNLDPNSFSGLVSLKSLNLSQNKISRLENVLDPLTNLKTLDVSHNSLQDLPSVFKNQSYLTKLILNGNPLKTLATQSFTGLAMVQELYLRECSLQSMEINVFNPLSKLNLLDLGQNRFPKPLSQAVLADLINLSTLRFDHNELHRLEHKDFAGLHLKSLDLSYNRINYIERTAFQNLTVDELDLSYNVILSLSTMFLNPLSSYLTSLNLAGNPVEKMEPNVFSGLEVLERLNISSCSLDTLKHKTLSSMPALKILDISNNNLHFLSQEIMDFMDTMKIVNLHKNAWICDCKIKPLYLWRKKIQSSSKLYCPPSRSKYQDCRSLYCAAPSQFYRKLLEHLQEEQLGKCLEPEDSDNLPASTQGAIVAACLGFAIIFLLITVYLWRKGKTKFKLKRVCVPSEAESSHMIDEDSKVPPLSNCDRQSLNESDHEFVVRHYFDTLVTDPKLMSRTSDTEEPTSPKERDSMYSSQPSLYSNTNNAALGIESTV